MACCLPIRWNKGTFIRIPFSPFFFFSVGSRQHACKSYSLHLKDHKDHTVHFSSLQCITVPFLSWNSTFRINKGNYSTTASQFIRKLIWTSIITGESMRLEKSVQSTYNNTVTYLWFRDFIRSDSHESCTILLPCSSGPVTKIKLG